MPIGPMHATNRDANARIARNTPRAAAMPSFDVISEVDKHELTNAVDQANRELSNRFDFKGSDARFELDDAIITAHGHGPVP